MNNTEKNTEVWERRWEGSEDRERLSRLGRMMFRAKARVISRAMKKLSVDSILEVGCGLGYTMDIYRSLGLNPQGIDVSEHSVRVCENKGFNVSVKDVRDVTEKYDIVSSDGMLEHFLNFEPYAQEFMRCSSRYVLLIQPNHDSFWGKTLAYLAELIKGDDIVFEYNYRINDFISVFDSNGFECVENSPIFLDVFRLLIFERKGETYESDQ